jgi:hypothetical protein
MGETKSKFLQDLIDKKGPGAGEPKSFSSERQHTAQSFAMHVDYRDGRCGEGVGWSHFGRYKWVDRGDHESLRILFGPLCGIEILGQNLSVLMAEIREGQLNGIREMTSGQATLAVRDGSGDPVITSVTAYPDFDTLFESLKKEEEDKHETRFTRRVER